MRFDIVIEAKHAGLALRNVLAELVPGATHKSIRKNIQRGQIKVNNGRVASNYPVRVGDRVQVHIQTHWSASKTPVEIVYEDAHLAVVNKPVGLLTNSLRKPSLATAVQSILEPSDREGALLSPITLHRLDKATSGLVIFCKTKVAVSSLSSQFEKREIRKYYKAVVNGTLNAPCRIDTPLDGKDAMTEIQFSLHKEGTSFLTIRLHTGRKNQIRRHLSSIGHPIIGDRRYGLDSIEDNMALCATRVVLQHPTKDEIIDIEINAPFE